MAKPYGASSNTSNNKVNSKRTKQPRVVAIDLFRGFLVILQSLDHARIFLTNKESQAKHENWYFQPVYKDLVPSIARSVTHIVAPGLAFMMGFEV